MISRFGQRRHTRRHVASFHTEALEARRHLSASLLKDVNTGPIGSEPREFVEFNGAVYFTAAGPQGRELYRSDGSPGSATLVADLNPGYVGSHPGELTVVGSALFFAAGDWTGGEGRELWKTDGTAAGTVRVKDILAGPGGSNPELLQAVDGRLYFVARDEQGGEAVWTSDGTAPGTVPFTTPAPGSDITEFEFAGDTLYFLTATDSVGPRLWAAEGSSPARVVKVLRHSIWAKPRALTAIGDTLVFTSPDDREWPALWVSDGTTAGTRVIDPNTPNFVLGAFVVATGGDAYFFSTQGSGDVNLMRTDGAEIDTVANIRRGYGGGAPGPMLVRADGTIFFEADDGNGRGLWRSGPGQPTTLLRRGPAESLALSGDVLFFGSEGELWKSDGTVAGTGRVRAFAPSYDGGPKEIAPFRGGVVFTADDVPSPGAGYADQGEPWFSDGTSAGTYSLGNINPATLSSGPEYAPVPVHTRPVELGGRLLFAAREGSGLVGLWTTDGTTGGTVRLPGFAVADLYAIASIGNGVAVVLAEAAGGGHEVWRTDGTAGGTRFVAPIYLPTACDCYRLDSVAVLGGELYFPGSPRPDYVGIELMKSDGTAAGTVLVKDINRTGPDVYSASDPMNLTAVGNYVYFTANGGESQMPGGPNELWRTDGTEAGTVKVRSFRGAADGAANARDLFDADGTLYFRTDAPVDESWAVPGTEQLWKSDGTPAGTVALKVFSLPTTQDYDPGMSAQRMVAVNGIVFFSASTAAGRDDVELWKTDGTPAGTVLVRDVNPGVEGSTPQKLRSFGGRVYFSAVGGVEGRELWSSDGTASGTRLVTDLNPGAASSDPVAWGAIDGRLYFTADDGTHGQELWSLDGTGAPTLVHNVRPGADRPYEPAPQFPTAVDGPGGRRIVFWADDRLHGMEPWVTPVLPPPTGGWVVGRHVFYNNSKYDGRNAAANRADDNAVAPDKQALRRGEVASFRNVTGYSRGINGVMVDVTTRLDFFDDVRFSFKAGNGGTPADWAAAPAPASTTRRSDRLPQDIDRITITWPDGAIRNSWLEVTAEALLGGRVVATDVFYFGNAPGETGGAFPPGSGAATVVTGDDFSRTRAALGARAVPLTSAFDHNRDGLVNVIDLNAVRANMGAALQAPTAPSAATNARARRRGAWLDLYAGGTA